MARFRVLSSSGAVYGDFADYELARRQAEHLTAPNRRHHQSATVQLQDGVGWRDVSTFVSGGAPVTILSSSPPPRRRPSALAAA